MTMNLFDQFLSPKVLGIPLSTIALIFPLLLFKLCHSQRLIPNRTSTLQTWLLMKFTKHLMSPINKSGHPWTLLLTTLMCFLLLLNTLGLLPYTFTPTAQLSTNMALAVPMWLSTVLTGLRNQPANSLAHMLPLGTPTPLIPILIIIETVSLLIRPVALGVRLTANLTAGHLLITLISTTIMTLMKTSLTLSLFTMTLLLSLSLLEIAVAVIQAYVFTLLLSLYLQENT
uniref:ATP synthase subunit a n=1 Tax=Gekko gecko TaxID=36310 RepID=D9J334_GEKGE|nr:ATP synthase F0 subunit 6 [Gekko gecko]